jgi:hypothetical protein
MKTLIFNDMGGVVPFVFGKPFPSRAMGGVVTPFLFINLPSL